MFQWVSKRSVDKRAYLVVVRPDVCFGIHGHNAAALDCIVADGCHIHGTVEDSVLFRDVTIARNAHVKNSIIMQSCTVGEGARLENVILDKNVEVSPGTVLIGSAENPVIIGKGETA